MPASLTIFKRLLSMERSRRCHFQFAIDFSFSLTRSKGTTSWKDRNITLILMSKIDHCHLRQVLTAAKHVHIYSLYMPITSHLCTENILYTHSSKHSKPPCCRGHLPQQVAFLTRSALTLKQHWPKAILDRSSRHYTVKGAPSISPCLYHVCLLHFLCPRHVLTAYFLFFPPPC